MRTPAKILTGLLVAFLILPGEEILAAISITLTGSWTLNIGESDLEAGAGSDLMGTYESIFNQVSIDIAQAGNKNWSVSVRKVDTSWPSDFHLSVRRTSDGSGDGTISGGTSYLQITGTDQSFFSGSKNRSNIYIQLRLRGVSIQISPGTYSTTVFYTVQQL